MLCVGTFFYPNSDTNCFVTAFSRNTIRFPNEVRNPPGGRGNSTMFGILVHAFCFCEGEILTKTMLLFAQLRCVTLRMADNH